MAVLHTYDPLQIKVAFKAVTAHGFAKGTFVKVKRSQPVWSIQIGADGEVVRIRSRDKTGTIELTLQAASETNLAFANIVKSDELNSDGVGTASVRDLNGLDKHTSEKAWLEGPPPSEYATDAGDRTWVIHCTDLDTFSGGSVL